MARLVALHQWQLQQAPAPPWNEATPARAAHLS